MRAKDFFRQVKAAEDELKLINARLRHYEEIGMNISSGFGSSLGGQNGASRVELGAVGAADALTAIEAKRREFEAIIAHAERVIDQVQRDRYRKILTYRYLCDWSFKLISDELKYTDPKSIYRSHGWALGEAQKILDAEEAANK